MATLIPIDDIQRPSRPPQRMGLALWDLGFRPFYLLAALYAALAAPLWALQYAGWLPPATPLLHAQEMAFGYAMAVIVGFLFTAGRNWSGHPTPTGRSLQLLAALWLAARVLAYTPWTAWAMAANLAFALGAAVGLGRALRAGENRRNDFFVAVLLAMGLLSALATAARAGWLALPGPVALQVALDLVLFVMAVMAGRVVPMFTGNALPDSRPQRHPSVERAALGTVLALLALDLARLAGVDMPSAVMAIVALVAALAHAVRLAGWDPLATRGNPLVWVLHLAYLWLPVHLLLRAGAALAWWAPGPAWHALTVGGIGLLTLAMMTRSARGHTARPLQADRADVAAYGLVATAAVLRVAVPLAWPQGTAAAALLSALAWSAGWLVFVLRYGPWLMRPRLDGRPG